MKRAWAWLRSQVQAQPQWANELDFVGPRVAPSPWSWLLLLTGLIVWAFILPQLQTLETDRADAEATLKRLQRAEHQQKVAVRGSQGQAPGKVSVPVLNQDSAVHAAQLAQWLGYPWMAMLDQVEAAAQAQDAVMLGLSLDLSTLASKADASPDLRLSAAVKDDGSALRWVQAQGQGGQLLSRERLSAPFVSAQGSYEWRVEATVSGEQP